MCYVEKRLICQASESSIGANFHLSRLFGFSLSAARAERQVEMSEDDPNNGRELVRVEHGLALTSVADNRIVSEMVGVSLVLARDSAPARMGEPDRALAALQKLLSLPYAGPLASNLPLTPALLRLDPMFDPLRNDPRFQKLAASPAPKKP